MAETTGPDASSLSSMAPGMLVGGYEIVGPLAEGAMGEVYSAVHPLIGRRAAIKVLRMQYSNDPHAVERFITEARAVNQIGHPNIVDVFEFGQLEDGRRFMVMELLVGECLRDRLWREPIPLGEALGIAEEIASALGAAHAKGVIHRDLKPDNVFLTQVPGGGWRVKLLDFGIAKLLDDHRSVLQTQAGMMMGTPAYMAPEQARGHGADARADLYSLGVVLYELATGTLPFAADNMVDMLMSHAAAPVPRVSRSVPGVGGELDDLIVALMSKAAEDRPSLNHVRAVLRSARHHVGALALVSNSQPTEPPAPAEWLRTVANRVVPALQARRRRLWVAIAIGSLAAVVGAVFASRVDREEGAAPDESAAPRAIAEEPSPARDRPAIVSAAPGTEAEREVAVPPPAGTTAATAAGTAAGTAIGEPTATAATTGMVLAAATPPATGTAPAAGATGAQEADPVAAAVASIDSVTTPSPRATQPAAGPPELAVLSPSASASSGTAPPVEGATDGASAAGTIAPVPDTASPALAAAPADQDASVAGPPGEFGPPAAAPVPPPPHTIAVTGLHSTPRLPAGPAHAPPPVAAALPEPRLRPSYTARSRQEIARVLVAVEREARDRGGVPPSYRGVTNGLAEDSFASFVPGDLIELHPRSIYYAIVRGARSGKSPARIAAELRAASSRGEL